MYVESKCGFIRGLFGLGGCMRSAECHNSSIIYSLSAHPAATTFLCPQEVFKLPSRLFHCHSFTVPRAPTFIINLDTDLVHKINVSSPTFSLFKDKWEQSLRLRESFRAWFDILKPGCVTPAVLCWQHRQEHIKIMVHLRSSCGFWGPDVGLSLQSYKGARHLGFARLHYIKLMAKKYQMVLL